MSRQAAQAGAEPAAAVVSDQHPDTAAVGMDLTVEVPDTAAAADMAGTVPAVPDLESEAASAGSHPADTDSAVLGVAGGTDHLRA